MAHSVDDQLGLVHTAGRKVRDGLSAVHKPELPEQSSWPALVPELVASMAGALAAFFVSRLVRSRLGRHGR